ncbi:hypothetical protein O181_036453 [Austropuccinia psidii MF-1]|uniref:Uncharacterized protein n=1 Tax=Austropuccinia psidii MF-1 TaxID=1389203 RepID=A0A9Q3D9I3_9BASI|nr:hypothetical protein [Austropuccinia psidii MF-1]
MPSTRSGAAITPQAAPKQFIDMSMAEANQLQKDKELTDKSSKFNIDDIIETRIKQTISSINTANKKVLDEISNSFTEVKTYTIALKKCLDASQEEVSKFTMKLNQFTADNTRQTELWQELTHKEDMYKIKVINSIQAFQHEFRNSQSCSNSKMNYIEKILNTLPRMSTPLNQNGGTGIPNPQVLDAENSQLKMNFLLLFITWNHQWAKHS